jgi:amidase
VSQAFHLVEASIAELRQALDSGVVTSVELVGAYLRRIAHYDRHGIALNAVPVLDPSMFEAAVSPTKGAARGNCSGLWTAYLTPPRTAIG